MQKKVLVISSSPRRGGNSDTLAERFVEGAREAAATGARSLRRIGSEHGFIA